MTRDVFKALVKREEFRPYYESARAALLHKLHSEELEKGITQRYLRLYDRDLSDLEDDQVRLKAELAKESLDGNQVYLVQRDPTK